MRLRFQHPRKTLEFWRTLVRQALASGAATPFYLFSAEPIVEALGELGRVKCEIPVMPWLSCKTQPIRPLLEWWRKQSRPIEVVSEFELRAALACGFNPRDILVNGPAKHRWLHQFRLPELSVNFDSPAEIQALLSQALSSNWRVGVRCLTRQEFDPEHPRSPTQFGMENDEAVRALKKLKRAGAHVEMVHFHLRTNVATPEIYDLALDEVAAICRHATFAPRYVDCGGGFPAPRVLSDQGNPYDREFRLADFARVLRNAVPKFPGLEQFWIENGRFLTARSGVLVVKVLDAKDRRGIRQLICDGGRTTHALPSIWEHHQIFSVPDRRAKDRLTVVCGPTCMAFDHMARRPMSANIVPGDHLVWMEAGAYHIPWETRFSHGLSTVLWHEGDKIQVARDRESFDAWWGQWKTH